MSRQGVEVAVLTHPILVVRPTEDLLVDLEVAPVDLHTLIPQVAILIHLPTPAAILTLAATLVAHTDIAIATLTTTTMATIHLLLPLKS